VQLSFRTKLTLIIGTTALGFVLMLGGVALSAHRQGLELQDVERRLVPKLELGPRLQFQFEQLRQSLQDAVAAQDLQALEGTRDKKNELLRLTAGASEVISDADLVPLRHAIQDYYNAAYDVSRRMIRDEAGEAIVDAMSDMRSRHVVASDLVNRAARLDRAELSRGFEGIRTSIRDMLRNIIPIGSVSFLLALAMALWVSRSALSTLQDLSRGFARFAQEDFSSPIPVNSRDEIGEAARAANQMANSLQQIAGERDHLEWIRSAIAELSEALRGDIVPSDAAARSLALICKKLGAPAALFFLRDDSGTLRVEAHYGLSASVAAAAPAIFEPGEGLVGQAALRDELLVLEDPPADYFRIRSGLGESAPRSLLFVPLWWRSRMVGVLEIALLVPCSERDRQLSLSLREPLAVKFDALRARQLERDLLSRTQEQAERLVVQEEELRANNMELTTQQEELREANEMLREQRGTLSQQNADLEAMRAGLEAKARELEKVSTYKSQFLANMSHELRTPLNSMLLLSHLMAENETGNLTDKQVDYCRTVHSAGKDLLGLINQILDLAKIEAGRQDLNVGTVFLAEVAESARRSFEALAQERGLRLEVEVAKELPPTITTDRQRVERILINLLGNAIKFTSQGSVSLYIGRPATAQLKQGLTREHSVAFAVTDTGIGIAAADRARVFIPFEQVESRTDRRYGGTGLGLAIARESAALLGGELVLDSEHGRGSTFTLHLPEVLEDGAGPALALAAPDRSKVQRPIADDRIAIDPDEAYLLIIEDDPVFSELLVDMVHSRQFKVIVTGTGEEGLRIARERRPIGIVLDVKLPDISGWTVMEHLRHDPLTRAIPVHFISGVDAPERGLALGAVGYLTKPASRSELLGVVQALQRPRRNASNRVLLVEDDVVEGPSLMTVLGRAGWDARLVKSAEAALVELANEHFGCMVLDLGLPEMDGLGLLETLHARPELESPAVIVHTARSLTKEETRRIEAYAKTIVLKDGSAKDRLLDEVRLFAKHVSADLVGQDSLTPSQQLVPDVSLEGKKILVAEDDMRTVYALSALLTGREALELLTQHRDVHGVLMDIMMPEMDGYEAMRQLRAQECFRDLPVIALTAKAMKGEREHCLEMGASDYLAKPIDPAQLLIKLNAWLSPGENREN
jgi:signal transduction histidine kinase/CheY-like chemotaxis protein/HAMP domain-containing protein